MLEVKPTFLNLGDLKLGETKRFTLEVTNNSDEDADFDLKPSCGSCTTVYIPGKKIKARETLTAHIDFSPTGTGRYAKRVTLWENGRKTLLHCAMVANVSE